MSIFTERPSSSNSPSPEELTWLQASAFIEDTPSSNDGDDIFMQPHLSISTKASKNILFTTQPRCVVTPPTPILTSPPDQDVPDSPQSSRSSIKSSQQKIFPPTPPRPEWIYRLPKTPSTSRTRSAIPTPYSRPQRQEIEHAEVPPVLTRSLSGASSVRTTTNFSTRNDHPNISAPLTPAWPNALRSRSRTERSVPLLKTIPSQSQIVLTPADSTELDFSRTLTPKPLSTRPPSVSSTSSISTSSFTTSQSSSRSESPVTPISISPYGQSQPRLMQNRRFHTQPDNDASVPQLSFSCPPSKSILTRSSSISTKNSSLTINKSVKFATKPVVHYASAGYWDVLGLDDNSSNMGIGLEDMDLDEDPFYDYRSQIRKNEVKVLDLARFRELHSQTPTPEREREKAKRMKRLIPLIKKQVLCTKTDVSVANGQTSSPTPGLHSGKREISMPYALGSHPMSTSAAMQSTTSLRSTDQKSHRGTPSMASGSHIPLRTAPSLESFRSAKSTTTRSIRSFSSAKSASSIRGFKAWVGRTMGWAES